MLVQKIYSNTYRCIISDNSDGTYFLTKGRYSDCWIIKHNGEVLDFADTKTQGLEMVQKYYFGELQ